MTSGRSVEKKRLRQVYFQHDRINMNQSPNHMKKLIVILILLIISWQQAWSYVIITGIIDGPLEGGAPKALELYLSGFEELRFYTFYRSVNGGPFGSGSGSVATFDGAWGDTFVYLVKPDHVEAFHAVFGNEGCYAHVIPAGIISGNGNEAFQIRDSTGTVVIDQVWWENAEDSYRDSYWYRNHGTGPDSCWQSSNWVALGNDGLDGLDEAGLRAAVPFGSYAIVWSGPGADWNDPANWSSLAPPSHHSNVLIPFIAPVFPTIDNGPENPAHCKTLYLEAGVSLTIPPGKILLVNAENTIP